MLRVAFNILAVEINKKSRSYQEKVDWYYQFNFYCNILQQKKRKSKLP